MIFFDIDGTLLDHKKAERLAAISFKNQVDVFGDLSDDDFAERWHHLSEKHISIYLDGHVSFKEQRRARIRDLFDSDIEDQKCDLLFNDYLIHYEENWLLFPDVLDCIKELGGYQLGIISNGDSYQQRRKLEKLGLLGFFSQVVISSEVGISKPDKGIFQYACKSISKLPPECFYVGDNYVLDAEGSRNSGMNGIWLNRAKGGRQSAGTTIDSLSELKDNLTR